VDPALQDHRTGRRRAVIQGTDPKPIFLFMADEFPHPYRAMLAAGGIEPDPFQQRVAEKLHDLHLELADYAPQMQPSAWKARLGLGRSRREPPRGIYLFGGVGRGKTMLMDAFFDNAVVEEKKQVHFHAFMLEVHNRLNRFRQAANAGKVSADADPIVALAKVIADRAWLLCFDEFHVTNIADAMILGRLFEALFDLGVVVVTTSNRPPQDLYKGGLQRDRFQPFIDLIEDRLDVLELDGGVDYRLELMRNANLYLTPATLENRHKLECYFRSLTKGVEARPDRFAVQGREIEIPLVADGIAFSTFTDLCEKPLGAADYLSIAARYHTLMLIGIPHLGVSNHNEAKRFAILVDALYEQKVNLICSAADQPDRLYPEGAGAFEFERTASRLIEMQSEEYKNISYLE
jgi:cell division protein ZapE